ncbi:MULTISPECIES: hypothetical protein [unclassified Aeromicrobium]|uniref:hypothetical protein n=1 Tax=unclassified Aeromicrobium TaxID=2633570 RepID=UPI002580DFE1|nr:MULTISPECIES: hypothetical protein [unclassified Aeromicrobium]
MVSVIYLHGVGERNLRSDFHEDLSAALGPNLPVSRVLTPSYVDLLRTTPADVRPIKHKTRHDPENAAVHRTAYFREIARLERLLPSLPRQVLRFPLGGDIGINAVADAKHYLKSEPSRIAIRNRLITVLKDEHEVVIVAHSLGSVIAIDLMNHLPDRIHVSRLLTLGSPLGLPKFRALDGAQLLGEKFPFGRVGAWVNMIGSTDLVGVGGLSGAAHPEALDLVVKLPTATHGVHQYLRNDVVRAALSDSLEKPDTGPLSSGSAIDTRPNAAELQVLFALRFSSMTGDELKGSVRPRYQAARIDVESQVREMLIAKRRSHHKSIPAALIDTRSDVWRTAFFGANGDAESVRSEQLSAVVTCATSNLIAPYEIDTEDASLRTVPRIWSELGRSTSHGRHIAESIRSARSAVAPSETWKRVGLIGAGIAVMAIPGVGIALGGGALAGAAALTTALAAFGPGGMVGGLVLSGTLVSAGGMAAAAGVLARESSLAEFQTEVIRQLALARAKREIGLRDDSGRLVDLRHWQALATMHGEVEREKARHRGVTDKDAALVKELHAKSKALSAGLRWLSKEGLAPEGLEP